MASSGLSRAEECVIQHRLGTMGDLGCHWGWLLASWTGTLWGSFSSSLMWGHDLCHSVSVSLIWGTVCEVPGTGLYCTWRHWVLAVVGNHLLSLGCRSLTVGGCIMPPTALPPKDSHILIPENWEQVMFSDKRAFASGIKLRIKGREITLGGPHAFIRVLIKEMQEG